MVLHGLSMSCLDGGVRMALRISYMQFTLQFVNSARDVSFDPIKTFPRGLAPLSSLPTDGRTDSFSKILGRVFLSVLQGSVQPRVNSFERSSSQKTFSSSFIKTHSNL